MRILANWWKPPPAVFCSSLYRPTYSQGTSIKKNCCGNVKLANDDQQSATGFQTFFGQGAKKHDKGGFGICGAIISWQPSARYHSDPRIKYAIFQKCFIDFSDIAI